MLVGARYYAPQVGRFITRDTYLDQKPYLYCEHDPVNATDPSRHRLLSKAFLSAVLDLIGTWLTGPSPPAKDYPPLSPRPPAIMGPPPPGWTLEGPPLPFGAKYVNVPEPGPWVRSSPGSGGALGSFVTFGYGMLAAADGIKEVVRYRRKVESYLNPDGNWIE